MNRLAKFGPFAIALGLCLGFAAAFPALLLSYVLKPIAVSLWLAWRLVISVDQNVYWTLLLVVCAGWAIRLLAYSGGDATAAPVSSARHPVETHVARWQALLQDAARTNDGEQVLRSRLLKLLGAVVGISEELDGAELEKALSFQHIAVPQAVYGYLFPDRGEAGQHAPLLRHLLSWFRRLTRRPTIPDQAAVNEMLRWMESLMEISHDQ